MLVFALVGALLLGHPSEAAATPWCDSFVRSSSLDRTKEVDSQILALSMLTDRIPKSRLACVREQLDHIVSSAVKICKFKPKDPGEENPEHKDFFVGVMVGEMISDQVMACRMREGAKR